MDDRTYYLAVGSLGVSVFAILVDAALTSFNVPDQFWMVPSGLLAFLAAGSAIQARKNGGS